MRGLKTAKIWGLKEETSSHLVFNEKEMYEKCLPEINIFEKTFGTELGV